MGLWATLAQVFGREEGEDRVSEKKRVEKELSEWAELLTPEQFRVARQGGTERAFTGAYYTNKEEGLYRCVCCGASLFRSNDKYDSGSGWPSFWERAEAENIATREDGTAGMTRVEICCAQCDAHLGHVFDDGPQPTGLRYCVNSASLQFDPTS